MKPKLKIAIFIVLTTLLSFAIGYILGNEDSRAPILIDVEKTE